MCMYVPGCVGWFASFWQIRELTSVAQEAFLVQLLGEGFMHCDPHPGERDEAERETELETDSFRVRERERESRAMIEAYLQ